MRLDIIRANFVVKLKKIVVELRFNKLLKTNRKKSNVENFQKASLTVWLIDWHLM